VPADLVEREERDAAEGRYGEGEGREGAHMVAMAWGEKHGCSHLQGLVPPWRWSRSRPTVTCCARRTEGEKRIEKKKNIK
jgi:hypothetical protein